MVSSGTGSGERPGGSALSEINVTPFVDVVLVLLVIFLVTAPMMLRGIDVKVPKTETKNVGPEERLMLTVTKEKAVYLDDQPITLARLEGILVGLRQRNAKAAVFLRADEGVAYGVVVKVMDAVKKAGIERLGMVTEPIPPVAKGR
ncbi:protein TolR [Candidatus Methylomirabilis limnetica]|uniref:Protein TolR n=1 Tax=Candidatus Methylomirabilis limnetica TaxID=2033718 RepID=A0A2T4TXC1_9BACT|nr:biopolymer transporter ExbD [Candidatus Methylomirabilis limnetica]PTL35750.1 protein TolR [Candidatus Methylomirabilis limnetica]